MPLGAMPAAVRIRTLLMASAGDEAEVARGADRGRVFGKRRSSPLIVAAMAMVSRETRRVQGARG